MQISRLFDKYWIHDNFSATQTHSFMMLVKTLTKLFEHVVQHPFAPLQAKPLRILFCEGSRRGDGGGLEDLRSMRAHCPYVRTCRIVRLRRLFGPLQFLSAASLSPRGAFPERWFALGMVVHTHGEGQSKHQTFAVFYDRWTIFNLV
jgi:hypothetical protein